MSVQNTVISDGHAREDDPDPSPLARLGLRSGNFCKLLILAAVLVVTADSEEHPCTIRTPKGDINLYEIDGKAAGTWQPSYQVSLGGWTYAVSVCSAHNQPPDPHRGLGDHCYHASVCLSQPGVNGTHYYMLGVLRHRRILNKPSLGQQRRNITAVLSFSGARLLRARSTTVYLVCDRKPQLQGLRVFTQQEYALRHPQYAEEEAKGSAGKGSESVESEEPGKDEEEDGGSSEDTPTTPDRNRDGSAAEAEERDDTEPGEKDRDEVAEKGDGKQVVRRSASRWQHETEGLYQAASVVFELHHLCACPGECSAQDDLLALNQPGKLEGLLGPVEVKASTELTHSNLTVNGTDPAANSTIGMSKVTGAPKQLFLILVVNLGLIITAILIIAMCCKKGNSYGPYNVIPRTFHHGKSVGSRETLSSSESLVMTHTVPARLDYSSHLIKDDAVPLLGNVQIPGHDISTGHRLGGGRFGDTYTGEWQDTKVVLKRLVVSAHHPLEPSAADWLVAQVKRLSRLRQKNLGAYIGICLDFKQPHILVERVPGETLYGLLRADDELPPWAVRIKICIQVAEAMQFLHSQKPAVLHRDLRSANVLVNIIDAKDIRVKVIDFGMVKLNQRLRQRCSREGCFCEQEHSALPVSVRWTAPEIVHHPRAEEESRQQGVFTTSCDVYSFAMVMWEVATATEPFQEMRDEEQICQIVLDGGRPSLSEWDILMELRQLMRMCWSHNATGRPAFKQILNLLKNMTSAATKWDRRMNRSISYLATSVVSIERT